MTLQIPHDTQSSEDFHQYSETITTNCLEAIQNTAKQFEGKKKESKKGEKSCNLIVEKPVYTMKKEEFFWLDDRKGENYETAASCLFI